MERKGRVFTKSIGSVSIDSHGTSVHTVMIFFYQLPLRLIPDSCYNTV